MATLPLIDNEMVDEVVKLGFAREEVVQSVKARQQNKVCMDIFTCIRLRLYSQCTAAPSDEVAVCLACAQLWLCGTDVLHRQFSLIDMSGLRRK